MTALVNVSGSNQFRGDVKLISLGGDDTRVATVNVVNGNFGVFHHGPYFQMFLEPNQYPVKSRHA